MSRPKRCRRICEYPAFWSFSADGSCISDVISMSLDEYETIRLIDWKGLTQEECACEMKVSRATVTAIYDEARRKIADFIINGKRIRVTGGSYVIESIPASADIRAKGGSAMRIAVTYEDGEVGQHFGKTEEFKIYDIEDGKVSSSQIIDTNGAGHGALAGFLRAAEVDAIICGGIGMGARNALMEMGIGLYPGACGNADDVVNAFLTGELDFNPDETCHHHDHEEGHGCGHHSGGCGGGCHH